MRRRHLRPPLWLLLLGLLAPLAAGSAALDDRTQELEHLVEQARSLGDRTPSRVYFRIAEGRDTQAFSALKQALAPIADPGTARAAFGACALFKGSAIEDHVVTWLANQSFKAEQPAGQLGATQALTYYWRTANEELMRVLRAHPNASCRKAALEPLIPELVLRGDRAACHLLVENADPTGRGADALRGALRHFTSKPTETYLASTLRDPETSGAMKLVLLDVFAERETQVARIALERRLEDTDETVRLRALELLGRGGDEATLRKLRGVAQEGSSDFVLAAMLELAEQHDGDPDWITELYAFTQSQDVEVRRGAAAALGRLPTRDALTLLHRLLRDDELEVRLTALEQIAQHRQLQSVPRLIATMGDPRDLYTHEVARTLRLMTGLDHGVSRKRWEAWFEAEGAALQMPTVAEALTLEKERLARRKPTGKFSTASFYGLEILRNKVCFVVDTSGSMAEPAGGRGTSSTTHRTTRLGVAKTELTGTLDQLLNGVRFNVISFAGNASAWKKRLVELDTKSRAEARKRIDRWSAVGGTAIYEALMLALQDPEVEAIYLLTDGEPTEGRVVDVDQILARIDEKTRYRDVEFHGVAIGTRSRLLRELAKRSGGNYTEIF